MRRFFVGVALYTLAAVTPLAAWGGDREIAEQIFTKLKGQQTAGVLQGFTLDLGVNEGRVVLKGQVSTPEQHAAVLAAAKQVEGVVDVVDQISVGQVAKPAPVKIDEVSGNTSDGFSLSQALVEQAPARGADFSAPSMVRPVAATDEVAPTSDRELRAAVIRSLSAAQQSGQLRGFKVAVSAADGDIIVAGDAVNSQVKSSIMELVRRVSGVRNVIDDINIVGAPRTATPAQQVRHLEPVAVQKVNGQVPVNSNGAIGRAMPVQFEGQVSGGVGYDGAIGGGVAAPVPAYDGAAVPMAPVPMAYGAPHYGSPNMPNYAWPGYAAYPNYAAVTYPQQYSPTAWPYIGPFYPYPQVPLGWRKVSLEWDDGWWFLDFTDK